MIAYRGGVAQTMCDGCYRPKRTGEDGWSAGTRDVPYRSPDDVAFEREPRRVLGVPVDWCPDCRPKEAAA